MGGRKLDRIITALCHHIKSQKVMTDEPVSATIPLSYLRVVHFRVALKVALKKGIKIVKNRAGIVKKRENLNLCFYWS